MSLPWTQKNLTDDETFTVKVFRDSPRWDAYEKYWIAPLHWIAEQYVCTYNCSCPEHLDWIEEHHPDCVFVY